MNKRRAAIIGFLGLGLGVLVLSGGIDAIDGPAGPAGGKGATDRPLADRPNDPGSDTDSAASLPGSDHRDRDQARRRSLAHQKRGQAQHAAAGASVRGTGPDSAASSYEVDGPQEVEQAANNRRKLLAGNLDSLEAAARTAEAEGRPEQAALMRRKSELLRQRQAEESGESADPAP